MKQSLQLAAFCILLFAPMAAAYEYPLQFTPNAGYRGLVVVGYYFNGSDIVGNCSYYTVSGHSGGRGGGGGGPHKAYEQTCTWDQYGNLLSMTPGAPAVPAPLYTKGNLVVYAQNASGDTTGADSKLPGHGFVNTPGPHYTWLTPQSDAVIKSSVSTISVALRSDGDVPVNIASVLPSALHGSVTLKGTTCIGTIKPGVTCGVLLKYDTTQLTSASDVAQDVLRIDLTSNAGEPHDFVQRYAVIITSSIIE